MPDVDQDWVEDTFEERVADVDGVTVEDVVEWYEDKIEEYSDKDMARIAVQADFNSWVNAGADGNVRMVTIGAQDDPFNNGDVFIGYALCIPEDSPVKIGAVEFRRDTVDADSMMHHFYEPFNTIEGEFDISTAEAPIGDNAYHLRAVESTTVSEFEPEKDEDELEEMVKDHVSSVEISEIGSNLSLTNDSGFAAGFGADLRLIEGAYVLQVRKGEQAARLVVQDNSFVDARDLGEEITGGGEDEGLAGFADPDMVDFGEGSFVDLYGSVTPTQDGQVLMSIFGIDPINTKELDEGNDNESSTSEGAGNEGGAGIEEERTI